MNSKFPAIAGGIVILSGLLLGPAAMAERPAQPGAPAQTPSGTAPAEPAAPAESPAEPAQPGKPGKPQPPSKPAGPAENGAPPEQTPSGTKPADPASPGGEPGTPADPAKPAEPAKKEDPEDPRAKKDKKDKPGKKEKGSKKGKLPGVSAPAGGAAGQTAPAAAGAAVLGGLLGGGEKKKEEKPDEGVAAPPPAAVEASSAPAAPVYSQGAGRKVIVLDFEGEGGTEFASLLAAALVPDLQVYDRARLADLSYDPAAVNRVSARALAAETGAEYLVTGKVSRKTATLAIISVYLRDGATGDISQTESRSVRPPDTLPSAAADAAVEIKETINAR